MNTETPETDTGALLEFMFRLGQAYLACGEQTALVELYLRRVASAYGMRRSQVVAFPTALFISVLDGSGERVTLAEASMHFVRRRQVFASTLGSVIDQTRTQSGAGFSITLSKRITGMARKSKGCASIS